MVGGVCGGGERKKGGGKGKVGGGECLKVWGGLGVWVSRLEVVLYVFVSLGMLVFESEVLELCFYGVER